MSLYRRISVVIWVIFIAFLAIAVNGKEKKRSRNVWHRAKDHHIGSELYDDQLRQLAQSDTAHLREVLKPLLQTRVVGTPGHKSAREFIVSTMTNLKWSVEEDTYPQKQTPHGNKDFTNIIATQDPSATRRLVLACHYDSKYMKNEVFIGATDSSVPCAMMMNLAHMLNRQLLNLKKDKKSDLTIQFIFFDGEEAFVRWSSTDSIYGARFLAERLLNSPYPRINDDNLNELNRIDLFILLDLLGTKTSSFYNYFDKTTRWYSEMISFEQRFKELGLFKRRKQDVMFRKNNLFGSRIEDDHIPFLEKGVPVLHLIPHPFPKEWHRVSDNENALDYDTISDLSMIIRAFVVSYLNLEL